jgi:hypothetical protein
MLGQPWRAEVLSKGKIALMVGLAAVLSGMLTPMMLDPGGLQTSYSQAPSGSRAFFELAQEFSPSVRRWHQIPAALTDERQTMLMLEPIPGLLSGQPKYRQQILDWVRNGNRLVVVPATYQAQMQTLGNLKVEIPVKRMGGDRGVEKLFADAGLELALESARKNFDSGEAEDLRQVELAESLGGQTKTIDGGVCRSVLDWDPRLQSEISLDGQPAMLGAPLGSGSIHLLLLPQLFRNKSLATADHAVLALTTVNALGSSLYIDEFFHGLPAASSPFELLIKPPFHFAALTLLLLVGLVLWAMLPRPYPIRDKIPPSRRSKAEHFEAMGNLIANGKEATLVMSRIHTGLLEDMRNALHMPDLPAEQIPDFLERLNPAAAELYRRIHDELKQNSPSEPIGQNALLAWGGRASRLRVMVMDYAGATRTSKSK